MGKHSQQEWRADEAANVFSGTRLVAVCGGFRDTAQPDAREENQANAALIADAPDCNAMLTAVLLLGWDIERASLFDEEGVEGWRFTSPSGSEYHIVGDWGELPDLADGVRDAIAAARSDT